MKIRRIILRGVRNFKDFDRPFQDKWTERIPDSLLLIGPNGSGKTTLLNVVFGLWQELFDFLSNNQQIVEQPLQLYRSNYKFAAMEIVDLDDLPIWVFVSQSKKASQSFFAAVSNSHCVGVVKPKDPAEWTLTDIYEQFQYAAPGETSGETVFKFGDFPEWAVRWNNRLTENLLGKRQDLPNLVYLESETRILQPLGEGFSVTPEPVEYRWVARYEPTASRKSSLQNYLYNLKVVDDQAFKNIVEQINRFLHGKRLNGFAPRTGELMVKIDNGEEHPIEQLSSGEKQVLLMIATITRWLQPGGIVLVDEPDLHLHVSLMGALVRHLEKIIAEKDGQLILASHAPDLWRLFTESRQVRLGDFEQEVEK